MAEPPNALTDLLRGTPEEMYETLEGEECLSPAAIGNRDRAVSLIATTLNTARSSS